MHIEQLVPEDSDGPGATLAVAIALPVAAVTLFACIILIAIAAVSGAYCRRKEVVYTRYI